MKKSPLLIVLFVTAACAFLINCGSDKTEIGWIYQLSSTPIKDIVWYDDSENFNQSWSETLTTNGEQTELKEITKRSGGAKCTYNGSTYSVYVDPAGGTAYTSTFTVDEGTSTRYTIKTNPH